MSRSWKRTRVKGSVPEDGVLREEQGDLLADAVSGAFFEDDPEPGDEPRGVVGAVGDDERGAGEAPPSAREEVRPSSDREVALPPAPPVDPRLVGEPDPWVDAGSRGESEPDPRVGAGPGHTAQGTPGSVAEAGSGPAAKSVPVAPPRAEPGEGAGAPSDPIPVSPWEQKMAWAKERAREGRRPEAEELYRELLRENPDSVRARNNLGILLDEKGDHEGAVTELRIARQLDPRNGEVLGNLGAALGAQGRYVDAEEALRAAHRMDPSNREIRANLGILYFRKGMYEEAEAELGAVCAMDPDHGTALFYRGEALNRLGRVDEAIDVLSRAVELVPGNPRAYHTLGVLFDKKRIPERAAAMYRKARELVAR